VATLDKEQAWSGWPTWEADAKRAALLKMLHEWRLEWVHADPVLVARLNTDWAEWQHSGADGLIAFLDEDQDWAGWASWSDEDKRSNLAESLDRWYPPEAAAEQAAEQAAEIAAPAPNAVGASAAGPAADRTAWVAARQALVDRLNAVWAGWHDPGPDGLATYLDSEQDWAGWETWTDDDKRSHLVESLDAWYGPAPVQQAAPVEAVPGAVPEEGVPQAADVEAAEVSQPAGEPDPAWLREKLAAPAVAEAIAAIPGAERLSPDEIEAAIAAVVAELEQEAGA
jgi:hypothetical protein